MSRTRRIYNSEEWKKKAIRHYKAKFDNNMFYLWSMHGMNVEEAAESGLVIFAGPYSYHKYKELCMGNCPFCKRDKIKKKRSEKLKKKLIEKNYILEMYI